MPTQQVGNQNLSKLLRQPTSGSEPGVSRVQVFHSFDALPPEWSKHFDQASVTSIFYSLPWFDNYLRTVPGDGREVRIYAAARDNGAVAILPMQTAAQALGRLAPRSLSALGNYYTSLFGPITAGDDQGAVLHALAAALARERPCWDIVDLQPLDREAATFSGLLQAFKSAGWWACPYYRFGNWFLDVRGRGYADYWHSLPSPLRNTLKRKKKQLMASGRARTVIVSGGDHLAQAIDDYVAVYKLSWKQPEPYPAFIPGLIYTCAAQGWLRLGLIYLDERPVAAQIWIVHGDSAAIFKLAYDHRCERLSPGSLLTAALMEQVIDRDQVAVVDYLTGDDAYKRDWMSQRRERWGIVAYNPRTLHGLAAALRHYGGGLRRRWRQAVTGWRAAGRQHAATPETGNRS